MEAEISLSYKTTRKAQAIAEAVSPDNIVVPKGLTIYTTRHRTRVTTCISCKTTMLTFISTIDDLLGAVSVAERSISALKKP